MNKTALVTGATSGIGRATARILAKNNYKIILCGRREDRLTALEKELSEYTEIHTLSFDVRDKKAVFESINSLPEAFSTIDILINNAGIIKRIPLIEMEVADFQEVIDIDLVSPFIVSKHVAKGMIARQQGKIINICSMMSELGRDTVSAYAAAKGAENSLTLALAQALSPEVRVNAICPAFIDSSWWDKFY